jgi:predicted phosphate transport protein (TIGR00153 family)
VKERVGVINDLEHQGDAITHQIFDQLHRSIITPFDREDIALLAHSLDDVADFIHAAADAMLLYKVGSDCVGLDFHHSDSRFIGRPDLFFVRNARLEMIENS